MAGRLARSSFAALVLVAVATPATIVAAPASVDLAGTLELIHGEDFEAGTAVYDYHLTTPRERVRLRFDGDAPAGFVNGARVRVHGHRTGVGDVVAEGQRDGVAADGDATAGTVLASAPAWTGPRRLAVVLVNFTNDRSRPFSGSFTNGVIFSRADSVRAYFAEQSGGSMLLAGTTFDWVRLPISSRGCDYRRIAAYGKAGLEARGVDLSSFTNFMFVFPRTSSCAWRGLGYLPGSTTWINGAPNLRTPAHELAHNLGVHHASSLRCTKDGARVALSGTCTRSEYGDPFTTMGASMKRQDHALARVQLGYLPEGATRTIEASGSYTLYKSFANSGTRVIGIPRGNGTWIYLEYRRPFGTQFDDFASTSSAVTGVTIRLAQGWSTITQSSLIDTVPSTTTFSDAPLRLGRTFKDYLTGITVSVTSLSSWSATVSIRMPAGAPAP